MAPEVYTGHIYGETVDVFSFAILAFELFSGRLAAMRSEFMAEGPDAVHRFVQLRSLVRAGCCCRCGAGARIRSDQKPASSPGQSQMQGLTHAHPRGSDAGSNPIICRARVRTSPTAGRSLCVRSSPTAGCKTPSSGRALRR